MADIQLERRSGESPLAYHKRLIYGKLVDKTLADADYSELAENVYGQPYSSDVARRMLYGSRKTLELMDAERDAEITDAQVLSELEAKKIELQIEKQKFFDQRTALTKIIRERSRQEELNAILIKAIQDGDLPTLNYTYNNIPASENDLLVSLNDIHYGAVCKNYWCNYDSDICREMMRSYLDQVISIGDMHRSENCYVYANGDEISGSIHQSIQVSNKENVIDQIKGVSELISEFLAELSPHFRNVFFMSVAGNHSRLERNKENAIVAERLDDLISWYIEARLQNFENVHVGIEEKIDSTMYVVDIRGKTYCGVHGDFDGSDSKIQTLQTMVGRPLYAVLTAHKHHNMIDTVQGVKVIMAGSFLGMDDFCVQKRIFGKPEQLVCVCTDKGIRCSYDIQFEKPVGAGIPA